MLVYFAVVAIAAGGILAYAHAQPHSTAAAAEEAPATTSGTTLHTRTGDPELPGSGGGQAAHDHPGHARQVPSQRSGRARPTTSKQLETAWDDDQSTLQPLNGTGWTYLDGQIDAVLQALRAKTPDNAGETASLNALILSFG